MYLISLDFKLKIQGDSDATVVLEGLWAPSRHHVNKMKTPLVSLSIASACWLWGISVEAIPPIRAASMLAGWWVSLNCMLYLFCTFLKTCAFLGHFSRRTMVKVAEIWCHDSFGGRVVSSLLFTVLAALSAAHTADGPAGVESLGVFALSC